MQLLGLSLEDLLAQFVAFLPNLLRGLAVFLLALYGSAWVAKAAVVAMERRKTDPELILLLRRIVRWTLLTLGAVQALDQVGFDVTSLIAGLGIIGFALGFALQDVAKNFIAGVLLLLQQPFNIGDAIQVAGHSGTVLDITLRTTELRTWDGRHVLIPNGDVYVKPIVNFSRHPRRRIQLTVGVKQAEDLSRISPMVLNALRDVPGALEEPGPQLVLTTHAEASIELTVYYWVDTELVDLREAQNAGVRAVKAAFEQEDVEIAFSIKASLIDER